MISKFNEYSKEASLFKMVHSSTELPSPINFEYFSVLKSDMDKYPDCSVTIVNIQEMNTTTKEIIGKDFNFVNIKFAIPGIKVLSTIQVYQYKDSWFGVMAGGVVCKCDGYDGLLQAIDWIISRYYEIGRKAQMGPR